MKPPIVINNENVIFVDVDDTLLDWKTPKHESKAKAVYVDDVFRPGEKLFAYKNSANIRLLKEKYQRGWHIVVWSAGGYEHATAAVMALKLENFVHMIMTKPSCYIDDLDVSAWWPKRVYFAPGQKYKGD